MPPAPPATDAPDLLRALAGDRPVSADDAVRHFDGARREIVLRHLETLAILGEVQRTEDGRYGVVVGAATA